MADKKKKRQPSAGKNKRNPEKITQGVRQEYLGQFMATSQGFGFVRTDELDDDIFVPMRRTAGAMDGDTVRVVLTKNKKKSKKYEGEIEKVVIRKVKNLVGTFDKSSKFTFVIPDNNKLSDVYIPKGKTAGAKNGQKVFVKITSYAKQGKSAEGVVTKVLGYMDEPGVDLLSVIKGMELPEQFGEEVKRSLKKIPSKVSKKERKGRKDLRKLFTVTIDGEDTKDFDDAITLSKEKRGYLLGVHIADVTHYVKKATPLDDEAKDRGTSIYLSGKVIPMLPKKLSNGICSLNEGEDRLTLSCIMKIDDEGHIVSHEIAETVIRVNKRMTYTEVSRIIKEASSRKRTKKRESFYILMDELARKMRKLRKEKGSIDFDLPECKIELDAAGRPIDIHPYDRNQATKIIEEFMLAANRTVAEEAYWLELPFVYRCHDKPDSDRIKDLARVTSFFGHTMKFGGESLHPGVISRMLEAIEGEPYESFITTLTLRSMQRAEYRPHCDGHFGLAEKYYTHFTSPIRRYPDLIIHRILKENMHGKLDESRKKFYNKNLARIAKLASERERRADDAERLVDKYKKATYMEEHIGEEFDGVISGVTSWGIYVALENTVEGMIRLSDMTDDRYDYEESKYRVIGHGTGKTYRLGERVRIRVENVDKVLRNIDFSLVDEEQ
ncbi:MAG: ribonuclease R [Eubacterium sp.]|nr:ribonuclease R [Eubacterium sp.]